jgi:predicted dienelactone hydrolase
VTEIRYPSQYLAGQPVEVAGATPVELSGGYPMIVFAHGYDVTPDTYGALLDAWVQAGFVVVAPLFPDEQPSAVAAQHGTNTEDDIVNEPADLAFVTEAILQASANATSGCPIVSGLVQASEIALAGHSDGATAVGMLAYDHGDDPQGVNYASLRSGINYRAVIILSGAEDTIQSYATEASHPDLLDIHSLADQCNPIRNGVKLYDDIDQPNKWFLALRTAHHLPPFDGDDVSAFNVVAATSIRFLQMSLQAQTPSVSLLAYGNEHPSVARMYSGALGRAVKVAPRIPESCGPN